MGTALNDFNVTSAFADGVSAYFSGWGWPALTVALTLIYFFSHYAFASLTAHFIAMYAPCPGGVYDASPRHLVRSAGYTNLPASLTHYGTPGPIVFAANYVSCGGWWKVGLLVSVTNLSIRTGVGLV
jgi:DASS family divalent anion:Na+ symporter